MPAHNRNDLATLSAFSVICRRKSFRLAATELGVTTSALSHGMRTLEEKLGVKLLNRTTRAVSTTSAGAVLAKGLEVGFEQINSALAELSQFRNAPTGSIRINVPRDASQLLISPVLGQYLTRFPKAQIEVVVDDNMVDIIKGGFDAGIRYGRSVPKDMVCIPLTPDLKWVVVASPAYLGAHGTPTSPEDLKQHSCIRMRIGDESIYHWELGRGADACTIDVPGRVVLNETDAVVKAALADVGIAYCLNKRIERHVAEGRLVIVMPEWTPPEEPFVMYYPSRRQLSANLTHLVQMIRKSNGLPDLKR
ncbi:LysR family transcriptional regulator [Citrobacter sp. R-1.5.2]|uniref:LysR family transcriptional regulator n=1 Tax=Citrobacter sp. R-1.5.2 TaxID=3046183 RepID=UPI002B23EF99|nr:LysR family transcriptional regulator [Citrobacter sp. R-1.5.2]MEB2416686.1 LysR family transcriptional regulator [Citrobacter sp. R-1.5.2]